MTIALDINAFARHGAEIRLHQINVEIQRILALFPDLAGSTDTRKRRSTWTAAQRKAHGERMRAAWAMKRRREMA